jgi:hypothetical protein
MLRLSYRYKRSKIATTTAISKTTTTMTKSTGGEDPVAGTLKERACCFVVPEDVA